MNCEAKFPPVYKSDKSRFKSRVPEPTSRLHRGQTSEEVFVFLFREKSFTFNVEASVRICEIAAEGKYIFSSLKRDSSLLKCSAPDQNCFDNGADSRYFAVFKCLELFK